MELKANENKKIEIEVEREKFNRYAIKTHFIKIGENYIDILEKYVKPIYKKGDFISISEKIISLCQKRIIYKKDMKVSFLARFLSNFAMKSDAGIGVDSPYKMQVAIDLCGKLKVIYAAILAGIGKLFKKKGIFYHIVGQEISGLDGFYGKVFPEYAEYGIRIPENSNEVCNEIYNKLGIKAMIVDANDFNVEINAIKYTGENDTITIKTFHKDGKCNIEVKDTGIGISDEGLKRVFNRFYREDKARSRQTGGTGLGLSIAHTIVTKHKGTIKAMHNHPKGTIILVKI